MPDLTVQTVSLGMLTGVSIPGNFYFFEEQKTLHDCKNRSNADDESVSIGGAAHL